MKRIYLIRHGRPAFPGGETYCLGKSDFPLSEEGRTQAAMLSRYIESLDVSQIWSSSLDRAKETARIISAGRWQPMSDAGMDELSSGLWDGLPFSEIKVRWPELYAQRGSDKSLQPPEAELPEDGAIRALAALERITQSAPGNVAVVTHRAVTRALIGHIERMPAQQAAEIPMPYGGIVTLIWDGGSFRLESAGVIPWDVPDDKLIDHWHRRCSTPDNVREHEAAVAEKALSIGRGLLRSGHNIDLNLLRAAALVHDIKRTSPKHWERGSAFLRDEGYSRLADIVAVHHGGGLTRPDEAAVLFYADKLIDGTQEVSMETRFEASLAKCTTAEAVEAHDRRYNEALAVQKMLAEAMR